MGEGVWVVCMWVHVFVCGWICDVYVYVSVRVFVVCNGLGAAGCWHDGLTSAGGKLLGVKGEGGVRAKGAWVGVDEMQDDEVDDMAWSVRYSGMGG